MVLEPPALKQLHHDGVDVVRRHNLRLRQTRSHLDKLNHLLLHDLLLARRNADGHQNIELPRHVVLVDHDRLSVQPHDELVAHELPVQRKRLDEEASYARLGEKPCNQLDALLRSPHQGCDPRGGIRRHRHFLTATIQLVISFNRKTPHWFDRNFSYRNNPLLLPKLLPSSPSRDLCGKCHGAERRSKNNMRSRFRIRELVSARLSPIHASLAPECFDELDKALNQRRFRTAKNRIPVLADVSVRIHQAAQQRKTLFKTPAKIYFGNVLHVIFRIFVS